MRIAVISDTHAPRFWKSCPPAVAKRLEGVDAIFHAGDICEASVLNELAEFAPVHAVIGNNDGDDVRAWGATDLLELVLEDVNFVMVHDSGPALGRMARLQNTYPDADCIVFGHSHIPLHDVDDDTGVHIFNPGSPTDKRRQPHKTMGFITVEDGFVTDAEIVNVD